MATLDQVCLRKPKKLKMEEELGTRKSDPGSIDGTLQNANTATCIIIYLLFEMHKLKVFPKY